MHWPRITANRSPAPRCWKVIGACGILLAQTGTAMPPSPAGTHLAPNGGIKNPFPTLSPVVPFCAGGNQGEGAAA